MIDERVAGEGATKMVAIERTTGAIGADIKVVVMEAALEGEANCILLFIFIFSFSQTIFSHVQFASCNLNFWAF